MKYDPNKHHRRSIRLPGYDYRQSGAYFVTICACQRQCLFGDIIDGRMILNQYGMVVANEWQKSAVIRREIELDAWVVMPNHFHGIVIINNNPVGANGRSPLPRDGSPLRMKPKSIYYGIRQEHRYGNVIITNISSVTRMRWTKLVNTSSTIPYLGQ